MFWEEAKETAASKLLELRMQQAAAKDGSTAGEAPNPEQAALATCRLETSSSSHLLQFTEKSLEMKSQGGMVYLHKPSVYEISGLADKVGPVGVKVTLP